MKNKEMRRCRKGIGNKAKGVGSLRNPYYGKITNHGSQVVEPKR